MNEKQTDVAALAAGIVAVAVSIFTTPGPYEILGALVAAALGLLIFGYVWESNRSAPQSAAFAAVSAIIPLPIAGYTLETSMVEFAGYATPLDNMGQPQSLVDPNWIAAFAGALFVLIYNLDRKRMWHKELASANKSAEG
jgi:hypothetical protein